MMNKHRLLYCLLLCAAWLLPSVGAREIDDAADLMTQQGQEKEELDDMRKELGDIKSTINEAQQGMDQLRKQTARAQTAQEVHLIARESSWEVAPSVSTMVSAYNGQLPGPVIRIKQGLQARIILHNQLSKPTSLCFHGMVLPHEIGRAHV